MPVIGVARRRASAEGRRELQRPGGPGGPKVGIVVWDLVTGKARATLQGHRGPVQALAFAADGKVRTVCSFDVLENINDIFGRLREGEVEGRVVLRLTDED